MAFKQHTGLRVECGFQAAHWSQSGVWLSSSTLVSEWSVAAWLHTGLRVERGNQVVHGPESGVRQLNCTPNRAAATGGECCLLRRHQRRTRVQRVFAVPNPPRGLARLKLGTELVWTGTTQLTVYILATSAGAQAD